MQDFGKNLKEFVKNWMLVISIIAGVVLYLGYRELPVLHPAGPFLLTVCKTIQPVLLFLMLFLNFCKIEPKELRPHKWMAYMLTIQGGSFVCLCLLLLWAADSSLPAALFVRSIRIPIEATLLCLICPTATACAVVTGKLGGNMAGAITYTVLINLLVAVLVPLLVPLIYPQEGMTFIAAFLKILSKVFPLLILPCLAAWFIRFCMPGLHGWLLRYTHWSFYIWAISLTLAILMSTRAIVCSGTGAVILVGIAAASILTCVFQFWCGKKIGAAAGCSITAGQAMGQKNTVFGIWMGYTFLDPVVSVVGGFYSICHNVYNTWQLYRRRKSLER